MLRASNPLITFDLGGHRGAGGPAGGEEASAEAHILQVLMEHIEHQSRALDELNRRQRLQRDRVYSELFYAVSDKRAEPQQSTQDQFRVTYIWAYVGGGKTATLHLKGSTSGDSFALPIPANTQPPLSVVLGDGETGGLILERRDPRFITVDDGSSQLIVAVLAGEILKDSFLS